MVKSCSDLKSGQVGTTDERSDRPTTVSTPKNKAHIEAAILDNRRVTVNELQHGLGLPDGTILSIIQEVDFHIVLCNGFHEHYLKTARRKND